MEMYRYVKVYIVYALDVIGNDSSKNEKINYILRITLSENSHGE